MVTAVDSWVDSTDGDLEMDTAVVFAIGAADKVDCADEAHPAV